MPEGSLPVTGGRTGVLARAARGVRGGPALAVGAVAFALRLSFVLLSAGGIRGSFNYDPGVYYASAAALVHGRLPYLDYTLLHPPGITLVLSPFAALGSVTTDHTGFVAAVLAFELLGAAGAALVVVAAGRLGMPRRAAVLGGLFYAVWYGAIAAEIGPRLEPLSSAAFAGAIVLLAGHRRRDHVLAGVALAFTISVKIWWIVPVAVLLAFRLRDREQRRWLPATLLGGLACLLVVDGPFFAAAPRAMIRSVVLDQLGRAEGARPLQRLELLTGLGTTFPHLTPGTVEAISVAVGLVLAAVAVRAWRVRSARPVVTVLVAQLAVLALSPSFFGYYDGYLAVGLGLTVAGAFAAPAARRSPHAIPAVLLAAAVAITAVAIVRPINLVAPFPSKGRLAAGARKVRCVTSDLPMALIELNVLSRDLAAGCPNWVDVTGRSYSVIEAQSRAVSRRRDLVWQREFTAYLLSGGATILVRPDELSKAMRRRIAHLPVVDRSGGLTLHLVPHPLPDDSRPSPANFSWACHTGPHRGYCRTA